jgi:hypothetical protein
VEILIIYLGVMATVMSLVAAQAEYEEPENYQT